MRERLSAAYDREIVECLVNPRLRSNVDTAFAVLMAVNRAHVVMLAERSIIGRDTAATLLSCLLAMEAEGAACVPLDPAREDLYYNLEAEVIKRTGPRVGGQMHTGRSRNDLYATAQRIRTRVHLLRLTALANALRRRVLHAAEGYREVVMTGYTHMQPAQPITFGHYLSGIADALARDVTRLLNAWRTTNLSPLGAAALATTGYPIDRERTAALLGFDGLVENSLDAVASRDYVPEILFALTGAAVTVGRLNQDLQMWCSYEFGFIDIDDDLAATSSIMPQKKNPAPMEHLKAKSAQILGALVASLGSLKGSGFMHCREVYDESVYPLEEAARQAEVLLRVAAAVMDGVRVNEMRMLEAAGRNFSTLTDLADALVREYAFSFREAHEVVGALSREAINAGVRSAMEIERRLVEDVIARVAGRSVTLDPGLLAECLDPRRSVQRRMVTGGPAHTPLQHMLSRAARELDGDEALVSRREAQLAAAEVQLRDAGVQLVSCGSAPAS